MKKNHFHPILLHSAIVFLILLLASLPMISAAVAGAIANANGCELDEGGIHPCVVNGKDIGDTLYTLGVMGWFMIATIPLGLGLAVLYIIVVVGLAILRRLARKRPQAR